MSQEYWNNLYRTGDTQWDKGEPSPGLVDFLAGRAGSPRGSVLVPGCGTGHDVRAWAAAGFHATGLDIAPLARDLARQRTAEAGLAADFRLGDFLRDEPFQSFDYLFEHTLFCAIQPAERPLYPQAAARWLKPSGTLVAIFYLIPDRDGPPFGSTREEITATFAPAFELVDHWMPRSYPNRAGLEWMTVWRLRPS